MDGGLCFVTFMPSHCQQDGCPAARGRSWLKRRAALGSELGSGFGFRFGFGFRLGARVNSRVRSSRMARPSPRSSRILIGGPLGWGDWRGLSKTQKLVVNRSWCRCNDRMGARCAPKCPSFQPPFGRFEHTLLGLYFCGAEGTLEFSWGANSHACGTPNRTFCPINSILYIPYTL